MKEQRLTNLPQVTIAELRTNLAEVVGRLMYGQDAVVITKNNKTAAVILSPAEYERLLDPAKRLSKAEWADAFRRMERIRKKIKPIDPDVLEATVNQTVAEVRTEKRKKKVT